MTSQNTGGIFSNNANKPAGNIFGNNTTPNNNTPTNNIFGNNNATNQNKPNPFGGNQQQQQNNNNNNAGNTGGNIFSNDQNKNQQPSTNQPNLFGNNNANQSNNTNPSNNNNNNNNTKPGGLFGNQGNTGTGNVFNQNKPQQNNNTNMFAKQENNNQQTNPTSNNSSGNSLPSFGGNQQNNATGNPPKSNDQPSTPTGGNLFANNAVKNNTQGNKPNIVPNQPNNQGQGGQNTTGQNGIFGQNAKVPNTTANTNPNPTNNLFTGGNKPPQTTTNPPQTSGGLFVNNPQPAKTDQPQKKDDPSSTNPGNTGNTGGANIFSQNNQANQNVSKLVFNNQNPTQNSPTNTNSNPPANNLFNQNKPATTTTTGQSNPTENKPAVGGNLFTGNNANQPSSTTNNQQSLNPQVSTNPTSSNPQGQNPSSTNPQQQPSNNDPNSLQNLFNKHSSKSVKQYVNFCRTQMEQMYSQLNKYSNNLLRYHIDREQNIKVYNNFEAIKPQYASSAQINNKILANLQSQQADIQTKLNFIQSQIDSSRTQHPLSNSLRDYLSLTKQVLQLKEQNQNTNGDGANHPSHQQLLLLYGNLDKIESDVDNMDQILEIYFGHLNQQGSSYGMNGYGQTNRYY